MQRYSLRMNEPLDHTLTDSVQARYGRLHFFAHDTGALKTSLETYGEWAENEIRFLTSFIREGDTVIDVGAYIGTHVLAFSHATGNNGHVIGIEAQEQSFKLLCNNVLDNNVTHVRLENAIAGEENQVRLIHDIDIAHDASFGSTSLLEDFSAADKTAPHMIEAREIKLDSLHLTTCRLVKIDAEGMEHIVLKGATDLLSRLRPVIYAECNATDSGLKTLHLLKKYGYQTFAHVVPAFNPENFFGVSNDIFSGSCEVALIGIPDSLLDTLQAYILHEKELILRIETADDLALAMLHKPQYPVEILRSCAAAHTGGTAWLDYYSALPVHLEARERDVAFLSQSLQKERDENQVIVADAAALRLKNQELERDVSLLREAVSAEVDQRNKSEADTAALRLKNQELERDVSILRKAVIKESEQYQEALLRAQELEREIPILQQSARIEREGRLAAERSVLNHSEAAANLQTIANTERQLRQEAEHNLANAEEQWRKERDALSGAHQQLIKEISSLRSSTSWKMTAPLRYAIRRLFRRR
ncbi:Methyltransferase [Granulibacter bethesdensis CGDNIH1]|uniref:Methyltransferase n=2 Tax=Granulibacter bethesdensis TaxID=364410 RepID=Q0BRW9_GRABC|nr:Methyltransferase [Granulibacter bethesdensis CGDNIH1]APH52270.1 Methyltransferase [Granulibacter bethesdensis]APH64963.1 Methyltransferase [Granulibacter bethesdensis]